MASFFTHPAPAPNQVYIPYTPASFPANLAQLAVFLQQETVAGDIKPQGQQTLQSPAWPMQENGIQQQQP